MEVTRIGQGGPMALNNASEGNDIKGNEGKATTKEDISQKELNKSIDKLNRFLKDENLRVVYENHEKFKNSIMVKIINEDTKEVIMEIPPKKIVDMVAKMCEMVGILIDKKA
ncbi:flagellar protein FlaG [Clostridium sp.]|uniref:flagellar protein FlaG n=1 Tax=Clostridium sp. TaxID=1506 RepID=UPI0034642F15